MYIVVRVDWNLLVASNSPKTHSLPVTWWYTRKSVRRVLKLNRIRGGAARGVDYKLCVEWRQKNRNRLRPLFHLYAPRVGRVGGASQYCTPHHVCIVFKPAQPDHTSDAATENCRGGRHTRQQLVTACQAVESAPRCTGCQHVTAALRPGLAPGTHGQDRHSANQARR